MATEKKAKFAKGDKVRVLAGDFGNGNMGEVESVKGERVNVVMQGHKDSYQFAADVLEKQ